MGRLQNMDLRGTTLDNFLASPERYAALTPEQVHKTFAKYYAPENAIVVSVKPTGDVPAGNSETDIISTVAKDRRDTDRPT